jgi:hypothetical protein
LRQIKTLIRAYVLRKERKVLGKDPRLPASYFPVVFMSWPMESEKIVQAKKESEIQAINQDQVAYNKYCRQSSEIDPTMITSNNTDASQIRLFYFM